MISKYFSEHEMNSHSGITNKPGSKVDRDNKFDLGQEASQACGGRSRQGKGRLGQVTYAVFIYIIFFILEMCFLEDTRLEDTSLACKPKQDLEKCML